MSISLWIVLSVASAFLYRVGGSDLNVPFKTKWRDFGVPACFAVAMAILLTFEPGWPYFAAMAVGIVALFGSLTTYWDHWGSDNVEWYEWALTGFFYGLSALPIALYTGRWFGFILRTTVLVVFMPFSNSFQFPVFTGDKTDGVEMSRGFVILATSPLLVL